MCEPADVIVRKFATNDLDFLSHAISILRECRWEVLPSKEIHDTNVACPEEILATHSVADIMVVDFRVTGIGTSMMGLDVTILVRDSDKRFVERVYDFHQLFPTDRLDGYSVGDGADDRATEISTSTSVHKSGERKEGGEPSAEDPENGAAAAAEEEDDDDDDLDEIDEIDSEDEFARLEKRREMMRQKKQRRRARRCKATK